MSAKNHFWLYAVQVTVTSDSLDDIDKGILCMLQQDARKNTTSDIGEAVGVSSSTVSNRIKKLEEEGLITGYHPTVDYEKAGLDNHMLAIGTVSFSEREQMIEEIMDVDGVISVRDLLTNRENVVVELVGYTRKDVEEGLTELDDIGVDIRRTEMMKREKRQPYNHFGREHVDGGE